MKKATLLITALALVLGLSQCRKQQNAPAIPGDFTVCASPLKKVNFAKGNLYWDGSSWNLEANQWDYRTWAGKNSCIGGTVSETGTPTNHCGLFKWGNATEAIEGTTTDPTGDFFAASGFTVEGETWFTLSLDEWNYLLGYDPDEEEQTSTYGRTNAKELCKFVKLTGVSKGDVYGLVILPDGSSPTLLNDYNDNVNPISEAFLSSNGAVFLPAAGYRDGTDVYTVGSYGNYWSSTPNGSNDAYRMYFNSGNVYTKYDDRYYCNRVRLVR